MALQRVINEGFELRRTHLNNTRSSPCASVDIGASTGAGILRIFVSFAIITLKLCFCAPINCAIGPDIIFSNRLERMFTHCTVFQIN
jgi:hypothetical protein